MTFEEAKHILSQITYKPGWKFILSPAYMDNTAVIHIDYEADEARLHRARYMPKTHIVSSHMISLGSLETSYFLSQVWRAILEAETHEMLEFFKVNGEIYCDPHERENYRYGSPPKMPDFTKSIN
jgi:hypothetical protein